MLPALGDHLTPSELAIAAYSTAQEPKRLQTLPGGHVDAYVRGAALSQGAARDWFVEHPRP